MRIQHLLLASVATLPVATAQFTPKPAAEVKQLARFEGHWTGSGVSRQSPDGQDMPWKATMICDWILDGFFLKESLNIEVGAPTPVQMMSIWGWNAEAKEYLVYQTGNLGGAAMQRLHMIDDDTLVVSTAMTNMGQPVTGRSVYQFNDKGFTYRHQVARGADQWFDEIEGTFVKVESVDAHPAAPAMIGAPIPAEMKSLGKRLTGVFDIAGKMVPMPGMPMVDITGTETARKMWDGMVLGSTIDGEATGSPDPYKAYNFHSWNVDESRYEMASFDNMGQVQFAHAWWSGDKTLIYSTATRQFGQPALIRTIVEFDKDNVAHVVTDSMVGTTKPERVFEATSKPRKSGN